MYGKFRPTEVLIALFKCLLHNNMNRLKNIKASFAQLIVQNEGAINDARRIKLNEQIKLWSLRTFTAIVLMEDNVPV
jgi:hypothetical protein